MVAKTGITGETILDRNHIHINIKPRVEVARLGTPPQLFRYINGHKNIFIKFINRKVKMVFYKQDHVKAFQVLLSIFKILQIQK